MKMVISNKDDEIRQSNQKYKNLEVHYEEKNKQNLENEREMIKYKNLSQMLEEKVAAQRKDLEKITEKYESLFKGHSEIFHSLNSTEEKSKTLVKDREEALTNIEKLSEARRELEHKYDKSREE
jgi:chromosome segregation ATPase